MIASGPPLLYAKLWPYLPEGDGHCVLNHIESCRKQKISDGLLPEFLIRYTPARYPDYEDQYIYCIRSYVEYDDDVILLGGGEGISAVAAAHATETGRVDVYEAGEVEVEKTKQTVSINDVDDIVTAHHALVGTDISVRSSHKQANLVLPADLPISDVLCIDVDGAEFSILESLNRRVSTIIVEHHAVKEDGEVVLQYQPDRVRSLLTENGYTIVEEVADQLGAYGEFEERIFVAKQ